MRNNLSWKVIEANASDNDEWVNHPNPGGEADSEGDRDDKDEESKSSQPDFWIMS